MPALTVGDSWPERFNRMINVCGHLTLWSDLRRPDTLISRGFQAHLGWQAQLEAWLLR